MSLWLRSRLRPGVVAALLLGIAVTAVFAPTRFPVPRVASGMAVPTAFLAPAVVAASLVGAVGDERRPLTAASPRPLGRYTALLVAAVLAVAAAVWLAVAWWAESTMLLAATRNLAAYAGIGLLAHRLLGTAGSSVPIGYALVVGVLGSPRALWSMPLARAGSVPATALAALLLAAGVVVGLAGWWGRLTPAPRET